MANVILTRDGKRLTKKASGMLVTPYYYDTDDNRYYLGPDTYDIYAIVGDTIAISQDNSETESVENEFYPVPVIENTTMGKWRFAADCADMQNIVMRQLFSAKTAYGSNGAVEGAVAMPSDFRTIYCCIQILFADENMPRIVLPKVLLSSGVNITSLRTNIVQNKIMGTPMLTEVAVAETTEQMLLFSDGEVSTYCPRTPLVFVPNHNDFGVLHHKDTDRGVTYVSMYERDRVIGFDTDSGRTI